jgi:hypothetical protein
MKDPVAVPSGKQHQRKEVRRKENEMLTRRKREYRDWVPLPRVWRAAIYLRRTGPYAQDKPHTPPSIDRQRLLCRCAATVLHAEVVGEFVDVQVSTSLRPGLREMLAYVSERQLDYLVVSSLDRLAGDRDEAFEIAWRLGFAGTVVIPADAEDEFPWTGKTPPGQE